MLDIKPRVFKFPLATKGLHFFSFIFSTLRRRRTQIQNSIRRKRSLESWLLFTFTPSAHREIKNGRREN
jgi:hypothetical protein